MGNYMVLDVYSRKIVGHEVHVAESAELASLLLRKASLAGCRTVTAKKCGPTPCGSNCEPLRWKFQTAHALPTSAILIGNICTSKSLYAIIMCKY